MAKKITEIDSVTTPVDANLLYVVTETDTIPLSKKITWANIKSTLQTFFATLFEDITNKKTSLADNSDTYYPTQKAVKTAVDAKQDTLGYTPEDVANKSTSVDTDKASDTKYPSVKAVYDWAIGLFQTLSNLVTAFQGTPDDTHYPSEKLVKDSLDSKQDTMTKAAGTDIDTGTDDSKYATAKAIKDSGIVSTAQANEFSGLTEKEEPADDDLILIEDSEATYAKKKVKKSALGGGGLFYDKQISNAGKKLLTSPTLWNIDKLTYDKSLGNSSKSGDPSSVFFKPDGTKLYIVGEANGGVLYQYTLSTAWDVSTAVYDNISFNIGNSAGSAPKGVFFKSDGTKAYAIGGNNGIYQYTLSTAWDVSTMSYASKHISTSSQSTSATGVFLNTDGTKAYLLASSVYQYSLSTAWDISTASYASKSFSFSSQDTSPQDISFKPDGTKLYIVGASNHKIYQYSLSTAWDVSTMSYASKSFSVKSNPYGLFIKSDGTKVYVCNSDNFTYQYSSSIGTAGTDYDYEEFISFPTSFNGKDIKAVGAFVSDGGTGTTGSTTIEIQKRTVSGTTIGDWTNILSTNISIDFKELDSRDAATQPVINSTYKTISSKDQFRVVVSNLSATDIYGLGVWFDIG